MAQSGKQPSQGSVLAYSISADMHLGRVFRYSLQVGQAFKIIRLLAAAGIRGQEADGGLPMVKCVLR